MIGEHCLVRTYSAGVHFGRLAQINGTAVLLENARRIWRWEGAFTLNELSVNGCDESSRISQPVEQILLTQAIEVIPCEPKAIENLSRSRNGS